MAHILAPSVSAVQPPAALELRVESAPKQEEAIAGLSVAILSASASSLDPRINPRDQAALMEPASFNTPSRLLLLDGDEGSVACRIYGRLMSATIPRRSTSGTFESATRSLLRMKNLTAVRGVPGASMVGPADYFGNLEEPHKFVYTIDMQQFPPVFCRKPAADEKIVPLKEFDSRLATTIRASWISGKEGAALEEKKAEYDVSAKDLKQSLFLNPGLLEIDREKVELRFFDPRGVDLSSFKARLVANDSPFQITAKQLPAQDEYRLVTYLYEPGYANWQIEQGSGLFLEKHRFSQTITPLAPDSSGFVALARTNGNPDQLELISVEIPYGYTLVIEEGCIHGDTTLNGFFMMGMTSDHTTMRTADTVFLKYPETKQNVSMVLIGAKKEEPNAPFESLQIPPPAVLYKGATESQKETYRQLTKGKRFIFNPFSRAYWQTP